MSVLRDGHPATLPDGLPDVDKHSCQLLGPTALVSSFFVVLVSLWTLSFQIVQGLMGVLVVLSLVYKRHRERPKRPWGIWCGNF